MQHLERQTEERKLVFSPETKIFAYQFTIWMSLVLGLPFLPQVLDEKTVWISVSHLELQNNLDYLQIVLMAKGAGLPVNFPAFYIFMTCWVTAGLAFIKSREIAITDQS